MGSFSAVSGSPSTPSSAADRLSTLVVAAAGALLGFIFNYALYVGVGASYPVEPTTFVAVGVGSFLALKLADRFMVRARREVMVVSTCVVVVALIALVIGLRP